MHVVASHGIPPDFFAQPARFRKDLCARSCSAANGPLVHVIERARFGIGASDDQMQIGSPTVFGVRPATRD